MFKKLISKLFPRWRWMWEPYEEPTIIREIIERLNQSKKETKKLVTTYKEGKRPNFFSNSRIMREEECRIKMTLKRKEVDDLRKQLGEVLDYLPDIRKGDTLNVDYNFVIVYFDDIAKKLEAVNAICKHPDVVVDVDCELLEQGKCLIYNLLDSLNDVMKTIKDRKVT